MRRLLGSIAIVSLLATAGAPLLARDETGMSCCRARVMACCLSGPGCAMKECPAPRPSAAVLPGLPPALFPATAAAVRLASAFAAPRDPAAHPAPAERVLPDPPPRG